jgi:hypothetical protein
MSKIIIKIATQMGRKKEKTNIPTSVNQVKMPGITSRNLCILRSLGSSVFGSGNLNI